MSGRRRRRRKKDWEGGEEEGREIRYLGIDGECRVGRRRGREKKEGKRNCFVVECEVGGERAWRVERWSLCGLIGFISGRKVYLVDSCIQAREKKEL